jgi:hypothetical protein
VHCREWCRDLSPLLHVHTIHFQSVDMFGPRVGFLKFKVRASLLIMARTEHGWMAATPLGPCFSELLPLSPRLIKPCPQRCRSLGRCVART